MKKYNHMFDVAFEVVSDNDWENVTPEEMIIALKRRITYLESLPSEEIMEAFGYSDTYEI